MVTPGCSIKVMPIFTVDNMLRKLGTYLRALGYDTVWDPLLPTLDLIRLSDREKRVFLTRNHSIGLQLPVPRQWRFVEQEKPSDQVRWVVAEFGLDTVSFRFTRCLCCNSVVEEVTDRAVIERRVPPRVRQHMATFTRCPTCDRLFWCGSHVRNTLRVLGLESTCSS